MKCQQCDKSADGLCQNPTDNGQSVECNENKDACQFESLSNLTFPFNFKSTKITISKPKEMEVQKLCIETVLTAKELEVNVLMGTALE